MNPQLTAEMIAHAFAGSQFIRERLVIPADMMRARFGSSFEVSDGRLVARGADGKFIQSKTNVGHVADFDEALSIILSGYESRDVIMRGSGASGGGAAASSPMHTGVSRETFEAMTPAGRMEYIRAGGTVMG